MQKKSTTATLFALTAFTGLMTATLASGGTATLTATTSTKRVTAITDTTTSLVTAPIVETKIEGTDTWVVASADTASTAVVMTLEEPIKPYIPLIAALISLDCNGNSVPDATEIANGAFDVDNDSILDSCEYGMGDLNLNGVIDAQDVSILLGWWGIPDPVFGDLNGDDVVDAIDLGILLGRFGAATY